MKRYFFIFLYKLIVNEETGDVANITDVNASTTIFNNPAEIIGGSAIHKAFAA